MTGPTIRTPRLSDMVNVSIVGERADLTAAQLRRAYDWTLELWERLEISPDSVGLKGADFAPTRKKRSFRSMRAKIEQADFSRLKYISFTRQWAESDVPDQDLSLFSLARPLEETLTWNPIMCVLPPAMGVSEAELEQDLLKFAALTAGRYGYIFHQTGGILGPFFYAGGIVAGGDFEPATQEEQVANICRWRPDTASEERVLRDIYPVNLLTPHFLGLPFGDTGMTLQEWIEKSPDTRGTFEPLAGAEHVTVWRPVIANLPNLRTELFKAGLLFYWRHFDSTQPEYRDFAKPFTPPEVVPAIFRPEFYAGRDPKVTR